MASGSKAPCSVVLPSDTDSFAQVDIADLGEIDTESFVGVQVKISKPNSIVKLVQKHWDGRLSQEDLSKKLPTELWMFISDATDAEEMKRRAKTFVNKAMKGLREEKRAMRKDCRQTVGRQLLAKYGLLAMPVEELLIEGGELAWCSLPIALLPELNCLPARQYFAKRQWDLVCRELRKLGEKRAHIEHFIHLVRRSNAESPVQRIVDFAGGRGDLALALAFVFPGIQVIMIERKPSYIAQARIRRRSLGLKNLILLTGDLTTFKGTFDLAVACHACGALVDAVLDQCVQNGARFFVLTCCFGKIVRGLQPCAAHSDAYPPAQGTWVQRPDWEALCKLGDDADERTSSMAMRIVNSDRVAALRLRGAWARLEAIPRHLTNKNLIIVGSAPRGNLLPAAKALVAPVRRFDYRKPPGTMRYVVIADTHSRHGDLGGIPVDVDVLVVAGDFTRNSNADEMRDFAAWLDSVQAPHRIVVAGNHEVSLDDEYYHKVGKRFQSVPCGPEESRSLLRAARYLTHESTYVDGIHVWGSPCQASCFYEAAPSAFSLEEAEARKHWEIMPQRVDIVVTHGPPRGIADRNAEGKLRGCSSLLEAVLRRQPLLHFFGHIHEGYGVYECGGVYFVNAAICTERYVATRRPIVVDVPVLAVGGLDRNRKPDFWLPERRPFVIAPCTYGARRPDIRCESQLYQRLCAELHADPRCHLPTGSTEYRNKAAYSLGATFSPSDLCAASLNDLATEINNWALLSSNRPMTFWDEVNLKLSRSGSVGVKLILRATEEEAGLWAKEEAPGWLEAMRRLKATPIESVTYQLCAPGSSEKPPKSPWLPTYRAPVELFGAPYLIEYTTPVEPHGKGHAHRVSPDSFSEVNHAAEDVIMAKVYEWARELRNDASYVALFGRNMGFIGLPLVKDFGFEATGSTHCWATLADAQGSMEDFHPDVLGRFAMTRLDKQNYAGAIKRLPERATIVHVTNSRHGLADGIVDAIVTNKCVVAVIYNSCNHKPLPAEWSKLMSARGGFEMKAFHSVDLLAQTEFASSIFLLVRRPKTLVLPVGPPGCGKTYVAEQLGDIAESFNRDRCFERMRSELSVSNAKLRVHEELESVLGSTCASVVYIDSTNGDPDAREHYAKLFGAVRVLALDLRPSREAPFWQAARCFARHLHPACCDRATCWNAESCRILLVPELLRRIAKITNSVCFHGREALSGDPLNYEDVERVIFDLFTRLCYPSFRSLSMAKSPAQRVALAFLTSGPLANDSAWQQLVDLFEKTEGHPFSESFAVVRHDDRDFIDDGFWKRVGARRTETVQTKRGGMSLVEAERRLLVTALQEGGVSRVVLLSGHCLPLRPLSIVRDVCLGSPYSFCQHHFVTSGFQRLFGFSRGALQWKVYHRIEADRVVSMPEGELRRFDDATVAEMNRYNLAPDETVIVNYLASTGNLDDRVLSCTPTYVQWELTPLEGSLRHAQTFVEIPEAAWIEADSSPFLLFVRKISPLRPDAEAAYLRRLATAAEDDVKKP